MPLPIRSQVCQALLKLCLNLRGNVAELGVSSGVTTIAMARVLQAAQSDKKVYAFDTWEGLPYSEGDLRVGECACAYGAYNADVIAAGVRDYVIDVPGKIEDSLASVHLSTICFAFFDLDLYESTRLGIDWILPRLITGALIGFHDYGFERTPGIKLAVDELISRQEFKQLNIGDTGDNIIFFRKDS
jgi:O-methyltransferase